MKPIAFPGSNIVIAENQPPYLPLPAQVFGDPMGTVLTCWELTEEDIAELVNSKRLYISHWTFNQAFQPFCPSAEMPVAPKDQDTVCDIRPQGARRCHCPGCNGSLESDACIIAYAGTFKVLRIDAPAFKGRRNDEVRQDDLTIVDAVNLRNKLNNLYGPSSSSVFVIRQTGAPDFKLQP